MSLAPQLAAFFTSAPILASSAAVNSVRAKAVGHMVPLSRFALSLKPSVAYLVLNFCPLWKKQTTLPSLAYAGIPYQSLGERTGALADIHPTNFVSIVVNGRYYIAGNMIRSAESKPVQMTKSNNHMHASISRFCEVTCLENHIGRP